MEQIKLFGLTTYEAKAYETLLQEGSSTAHYLAKRSGVPSGKIYPTLESLEEKGFVKGTLGRPKMFTAISPEIVLDKVLKEKKDQTSLLKQQVAILISAYSKPAMKKDKPEDLVETYFGHSTAFAKSVALHDQATKYWKTISHLTINKEHLDACSRALKRGGKIMAITSSQETSVDRVTEWRKRGIEVRFLEELPFRFSVYDDKGVIFRFSHEKSKQYVSTHIRNAKLAQGMSRFFDGLWAAAKK